MDAWRSTPARPGAQRAGCRYHLTTSRIRASLDSTLAAAVIVGVMFADGLRWFREDAPGRRTPLSTEEAARAGVALPRVLEQDCTQPVQTDAGNLRCR
jgi:hypothetical protein